MTTTILKGSVVASSIEEQKQDYPQTHTTTNLSKEEQANTKKAQIKASEDIGAFLGACVPQMRHLMTWIKGSSPESTHFLPVQAMLVSSSQDPETVIANFKYNVQDTINKLVEDGLYLTKNYTTELNIKKMGDLSAHSILASLLARIYEIELSLEKAFPPYTSHMQELSPYYKLHQTFLKEKNGLEKLQQKQEIKDLQQATSSSLKDPLARLMVELEQKFQKAQNGLKRLTVALPQEGIPNFSSLESKESTISIVSPRGNISPSTILRSKASPPNNGRLQFFKSAEEGTAQLSSTTQEKTDIVVKRGRSKSATSSSISSINVSSTHSSPNLKKAGRSESIGMQLITPEELQKSPKFASRAEEASSSSNTPVQSTSPRKGKSKIFKNLKSSFTKKGGSTEENSTPSSSGTPPSSLTFDK